MALESNGRPWRVFLSHSSELGRFPVGRSFVAAATDAIIGSGHEVVDMAHFAARDKKPSAVCREEVEKSDVVVVLAGFRYGSVVLDEPDRSYVELEYAAAGEAGRERIVLLLDQEAEGPSALFRDHEHGAQQENFRQRLQTEVLCKTFRTPDDLTTELLRSLTELRSWRMVPPSSHPSRRAGSVFAVPDLQGNEVPRPEIVERVVAAALRPDIDTVGVTTGLVGAGGFGKTTLARVVVHDPRIRATFTDGVVWLTVGEDRSDADLAAMITSTARLFDASVPDQIDPRQAGDVLRALLDDLRVLMVVDDVWSRAQVEPFLGRGQSVRLFTSRQRLVLPAGAAMVSVDEMNTAQATTLLTADLPPLDPALVADALAATGCWPLLLSLVHGFVLGEVGRGARPDAELAAAVDALRVEGITVLDVNEPGQRDRAVGRTIEISLRRLEPDEYESYLQLAVFGEDVRIPIRVLARYWGHTAGWSEFRTRQFCSRLFSLSLLVEYRRDTDHVQLHDVVLTYLRHQTRARRPELDVALLQAHRSIVASTGDRSSWWQLPSDHYLWIWLASHLTSAGLFDELDGLLEEPEWLTGKLNEAGPAGLEVDLLLGTTPQAVTLGKVVRQNAQVLGPLSPPGALAATLLSRLPNSDPDIEPVRERLRAGLPPGALVAIGAPPDLPHPALHRVLAGQTGTVQAFTASPDGRWVATGGSGKTIRVWDRQTGHTLQVFAEGLGEVTALAVGPDGDWLVSGSRRPDVVQLWDVDTGVLRHTLAGHAGPISALAVAPDGEWFASAGGTEHPTVQMWDPVTGRALHTFTGHAAAVNALAIDPDGNWIVSADGEGRVLVWDTRTGQRRLALDGHTSAVNALAVAPDGGWLATGDGNPSEHGVASTVRIWETDTGHARHVLNAHNDRVTALVVAPDGAWLASASTDAAVCIWDPVTGKRTQRLTDRSGRVNALVVSPGGTWIAAASGSAAGGDSGIRIWNPLDGRLECRLSEHTFATNALAVTADGNWLISARADATVRVWALPARTADAAEGHLSEVNALIASPEGRWIVSAAGNRYFEGDTSVRMWESASGHAAHVLAGHDQGSTAAAFSPDGTWFATGGGDRLVRLHDATDGQTRETLLGGRRVNAIVISGDGSWLAAAEGDLYEPGGEVVRIWDVASAAETHVLDGHRHAVSMLAAGPDNSWIASADTRGDVNVWDVSTGEIISELSHPGLDALAVNPTGSMLASIGWNMIRIWDIRTGEIRGVTAGDGQGHRHALQFASNGTWLATTNDRTIQIREPSTGTTQRELVGHTGPVTALAASTSDESWLVSVGGLGDCTVRTWNVATGEALAAFRVADPLHHVAMTSDVLAVAGTTGPYFLRFAVDHRRGLGR